MTQESGIFHGNSSYDLVLSYLGTVVIGVIEETYTFPHILQSSQYIELLQILPFSYQLYHSPLHVLQLSEHQTITKLSSWLKSSAKGKLLFITTSQSFDFPTVDSFSLSWTSKQDAQQSTEDTSLKAFHALHGDIRDKHWPTQLWVRWTIYPHTPLTWLHTAINKSASQSKQSEPYATPPYTDRLKN